MRSHTVFLDIDGTIAHYGFPPTDGTRHACRSLKQAGHRIAICTARAITEEGVQYAMEQLGLI